MPRSVQPADFFVVGGPVQPDRRCYVVRAADGALADSIAAQRFTYVLGPRAIGKSSLIGRCVQELRRSGQLAAVIDLSQIGARGDGSDPARWYYSIAYRVLRELRLKLDLQSWWQEKAALPSEQRFMEFFGELVLAQTKEPVTVFFDDIERTIELPFARQFFSALKSCYSHRVSEPEFERLNFVALGVAAPEQLCSDPTLSPFSDGRRIDLDDFTEAEAQTLAAGFEMPREQAEGVLGQIYAWTRGQPYLTQKLARGTVRRGGRLADVERAVNQQFLTSSAAQSEPLLVQIRAQLAAPGPGLRQALNSLVRLSRGAEVADEPGAFYRRRLWLAGVVVRDEDGRLRYRNRIFARVFDAAWARSVQPFNWRRPAGLAAAAAVLVAIPVWYTQLLPAPAVETLESPGAELVELERAYQRLRGLPGFSGAADRLLTEALSARSRSAESFAAVREIDGLLREELEGHTALADTLMADYWLRAARAAAHAERRDAALLLTMAAREGRPERARALGAELVGEDYGHLERTLRVQETPIDWASDWDREDLTLVDPSHRVERIEFGAGAASGAPPAASLGRLTAPQHVPIEREVTVESAGRAGAFELVVSVDHPRASDLLVRLTAPSGVEASAPIPEPREGAATLTFRAAGGGPLAALAEQERQGLWQLSIVDRQRGQTGTLVDWALSFDTSQVWRDQPEQPLALPDPLSSEQVEIQLSGDGRIALAQPTREGASGALAVWNLADGSRVNDFEYRQPPTSVQITADARRLVVASPREITIWNVREGTVVTRLETATGFLLAPAVGFEQRHLAVAERVEAQVPRYRLVSLEDGSTLATVNGLSGVDDWVLGAESVYLALRGPGPTVRVLDPFTGRTRAELRHDRDVARVLAVPANDNRLVTVDTAGEIFAWTLGEAGTPARSAHVATTADPASVSVARAAETIAFVTPGDHVVVRDLGSGQGANRFRVEGGADVSTELAPDASRLWTASGAVLRLWRVERPPASPRPVPQLSAVALDAAGELAAFGYDGGHVRVLSAADLGALQATADGVDYIGHRGAVTALGVNAGQGLVASGGSDGVVRLWELADVAPNDLFLRHPEGPVHAVAVSPDGRWIASGAAYSARVWRADDGEPVGEVPVNGAATAVAFRYDGLNVAVGDTAGNLFFGDPSAAEPLRSARAGAAVTAVVYSADGARLASGDASGRVQIRDYATGGGLGAPLQLRHPIAWLSFVGPDALYVQSGDWVHHVQRTGNGTALEVTATRLLPLGLEAAAAPTPSRVDRLRFLGLWGAERAPRRLELDMSAPLGDPLPPGSALLTRDWSHVLGLELDRATGTVRELP